MRQRGLGKKERPGQIDREDPVPVVVGHLGHRLVERDAGVVDQDVQAAVEVDDLADSSSTVIPARDIALMDTDLRAVTGCRQLGEELLCLLSVPAVPSGHRCSLTGQALADRRTDSASTTRHESNSPTELSSSSLHESGLADLINRNSRRRHRDLLAVALLVIFLVLRNLCRLLNWQNSS